MNAQPTHAFLVFLGVLCVLGGGSLSKQIHLFVKTLRNQLGCKCRVVATIGFCEFVFFPQALDELREPLAVGLGQKSAVFVTLAIARGQMWKVRFEEGKKYRGRAGFQE